MAIAHLISLRVYESSLSPDRGILINQFLIDSGGAAANYFIIGRAANEDNSFWGRRGQRAAPMPPAFGN